MSAVTPGPVRGKMLSVNSAAQTPMAWQTLLLPELAGYTEATEILGVSKMTLGRWLEPGSGKGEGFGADDTFLIGPARTKSGPVWVADDLRHFKAAHAGRRRAAGGSDAADGPLAA